MTAAEPKALERPHGPGPCSGCLGLGFTPGDVYSGMECPVCRGTGQPRIEWELVPVTSYKSRRAMWDAADSILAATRTKGKKSETTFYAVHLWKTASGVAWEVEKDGTGEIYVVKFARDRFPRWSCTCKAGVTYQGREGFEAYPSRGCIHADAIADLFSVGWFSD